MVRSNIRRVEVRLDDAERQLADSGLLVGGDHHPDCCGVLTWPDAVKILFSLEAHPDAGD